MQVVCQLTGGNMWTKYVKEREGVDTLKYEFGFALIKRIDKVIWLKDIYIEPEFRRMGRGRQILADVEAIAKSEGAVGVLGSIAPEAQGSHESLLALIGTGFKLHNAESGMVYMLKEF